MLCLGVQKKADCPPVHKQWILVPPTKRVWLHCVLSIVIFAGHAFTQDQSSGSTSSGGTDQSMTDNSLIPLPNSLDTDLPLRVVSSPFHWGRISLLSLTAYQGYETNPRATQSASESFSPPTEFSAFNAFLVYSIRHPSWELDLQYEPSIVASPGLLRKNLSGNATDFQLSRRLSETWTLAIGDHFRYSPDLQSSIQGNNLSLNLGGGISVQIPFLQSNESLLTNTSSTSLTHRLSEGSYVVVGVTESYLRVAPSTDLGRIQRDVPATDAYATDVNTAYTSTVSARDTVFASYDFRGQFASEVSRTSTYHILDAGWGHVVTQGLRLSFSGGPGFYSPGGSLAWHTTIQGTVEVEKSYRRGEIGVAFSRNDSFNGVLSNSFANHYALNLNHRFTTRVRLTANYSYIQQQIFGAHDQNGALASVEPSWLMTRNWSVFGQVRYLSIQRSNLSIPSDKVFTAGVRWSWVPEKP